MNFDRRRIAASNRGLLRPIPCFPYGNRFEITAGNVKAGRPDFSGDTCAAILFEPRPSHCDFESIHPDLVQELKIKNRGRPDHHHDRQRARSFTPLAVCK